MTGHFYILDADKRVVKARNHIEWARFFESPARIVAQANVGPLFVSTVFLGLDHRFGGRGPPLVFETMVLGPPEDVEIVGKLHEFRPHRGMRRYSTWDEAARGHAVAIEIARQKLAEIDAEVATGMKARHDC